MTILSSRAGSKRALMVPLLVLTRVTMTGFGGGAATAPIGDRTSTGTARDEYHPSFSPDGTTTFFVRDGTLHQLATEAIGLPPAT